MMNYTLSDIFNYKIYITSMDDEEYSYEFCEINRLDPLQFGILNNKGPEEKILRNQVCVTTNKIASDRARGHQSETPARPDDIRSAQERHRAPVDALEHRSSVLHVLQYSPR